MNAINETNRKSQVNGIFLFWKHTITSEWNVFCLVFYKKTGERYIEWHRMTTSDSEWYKEWQWMTTSGTTSDNNWQGVTRNDNEWHWVTKSGTIVKMTQYTSKNGWLQFFV